MHSCKTIAIMAAGLGTRFKSLKQLHPITPDGNSILDFSIFDALEAGFNRIIFIVSESTLENFKKRYEFAFSKDVIIEFVIQDTAKYRTQQRQKPWGTGHALLLLKEHITSCFALINADDFYGKSTFKILYDALFNSPLEMNYFVAYLLKHTLSNHGTVSRGECFLKKNKQLSTIIERINIKKQNNSIVYLDSENTTKEISPNTLVSMNFWGFQPSIFSLVETLFSDFLKDNITSETSEFYITHVVNHSIKNNLMDFKMLITDSKWYGITYIEDQKPVSKYIQNLINIEKYPKILW